MAGNQAGTVLYPATTLNCGFERIARLLDKGQQKAECDEGPWVRLPDAKRSHIADQNGPQCATGEPCPGFAGRDAGDEFGAANELPCPIGSGIDGPNKK